MPSVSPGSSPFGPSSSDEGGGQVRNGRKASMLLRMYVAAARRVVPGWFCPKGMKRVASETTIQIVDLGLDAQGVYGEMYR